VSKRTLLLADDSVTIQKVVNLTFADEGIDVITVGDGDSAMEKISQISPDVVLADVHMPGLSGYQICEILRQNPVTREMPVVLLVGSFEPFDESEAARVGANAYLTKPFQSIRQLVSQVTDLMDASGARPEAAPAEAEPEAVVAPEAIEEEAPEVDDIESLYHQSFGEPAATEVEGEAAAAPRYVDAGMDDEMIETTPAGWAEEPTYDASAQLASFEDERPGEFVSETNVAESAQATYSAPEPVAGFAEADRMEPTQEFASLVDDRGEIAEAVPAVDDRTAEFDEFSNTHPSVEVPASAPVSQLAQDETEILELPPIENGKTLEFTTTQRMRAESAAKELVSLSPELMDMLVQKVVEKLSEK
jgi:CheY-like chemotaxis protein